MRYGETFEENGRLEQLEPESRFTLRNQLGLEFGVSQRLAVYLAGSLPFGFARSRVVREELRACEGCPLEPRRIDQFTGAGTEVILGLRCYW